MAQLQNALDKLSPFLQRIIINEDNFIPEFHLLFPKNWEIRTDVEGAEISFESNHYVIRSVDDGLLCDDIVKVIADIIQRNNEYQQKEEILKLKLLEFQNNLTSMSLKDLQNLNLDKTVKVKKDGRKKNATKIGQGKEANVQ